MHLTAALPTDRRERVEARLRHNLMAWLTTVRPDGQPVSVPVWFLLREDETVLVYSESNAPKLRYVAANPRVALGLDMTDIGRDIVRVDGIAEVRRDVVPANLNPAYIAKYTERIGIMFGTADRFAAMFAAAVIITPTRLRA